MFGDRALGSLKRSEIESWAKGLELAPGTVGLAHRHLRELLGAAAEDGLIVRNPASRAKLPKASVAPAEPPTVEQVRSILDAAPDKFRAAVVLGAGAGLRSAEVLGLTVDRVDFLRRSVRVDRQLLRAKPPTFGPPKSEASYRTVPLAEPVVLEMSEHLRRTPSDDLVFNERGSPIDHNRAGHLWRTTCARAGVVGVRFHDLRHFYASTLLSAGVSIKAVQSHLGHGSAALTLDVYGHLMPSDDDRSRSAIGEVFSATEDSLRTGAGT